MLTHYRNKSCYVRNTITAQHNTGIDKPGKKIQIPVFFFGLTSAVRPAPRYNPALRRKNKHMWPPYSQVSRVQLRRETFWKKLRQNRRNQAHLNRHGGRRIDLPRLPSKAHPPLLPSHIEQLIPSPFALLGLHPRQAFFSLYPIISSYLHFPFSPTTTIIRNLQCLHYNECAKYSRLMCSGCPSSWVR